MKTPVYLSLLAAFVVGTTGCFVYERRTVPATTTTTYVEPAPTVIGSSRTVTVLPTGYRTTVYRGTTYYYSGDTYYTAAPRGGYVVTTRPY